MTSLIPLLLAGMLLGQPGPGPGPRADGPPRGRQAGPPADITPLVDRIAEVVNATPEQIEELTAIAQEHKAKAQAAREARQENMKANQEQFRALREQMREARQAGDDQKVTELRNQMRELMGPPPGDLMQETHEKIAAILTPEQKTAFEEFLVNHQPILGQRAGRMGQPFGGAGQGTNIYGFMQRLIETVDATEEQRKQLRVIAAEHVRAMKAAEADQTIAWQDNREQVEALRAQMREAQQAGKTEEVAALRQQMQELVGTPAADVLKATHEKIGAILTPEQKVKFDALVEEVRSNLGQRGEGHRRGFKAGKAGPHKGHHGQGRRGRGPEEAPAPPAAEGDEAT